MALIRTPQLMSPFEPGDLTTGYYNDLRGVADSYTDPDHAAGWLELLIRRRATMWPVSVLQLGMGSWQHVVTGSDRWAPILRTVVDWAIIDMDGHGRFAHLQPMPHTYHIEPPWHSAMAQGQAVSLLVRAASTLDRPELIGEAERAARSLLDDTLGLIVETDEGDVLQEYPSEPPAHVLNGWIWALWGLHDLGLVESELARESQDAFRAGVTTLVARLPRYMLASGWTRYDLFPHPIKNVASPFYHRLHIEQLRALNMLEPREELQEAVMQMERALASPAARVSAVMRKVGFRLVRPRGKAA